LGRQVHPKLAREPMRFLAGHERFVANDLVKEILAGWLRDGRRIKPGALGEFCDLRLERRDVTRLDGVAREMFVPFGESAEFGVPERAGFSGAKPLPVNHGPGPNGRMIPGELEVQMRG